MRTLLVLLTLLVATPILGSIVIVSAMLGIQDRPGSVYAHVPRWWTWLLIKAAGARITIHGDDQQASGKPHVYVANHISWFDVFSIASHLRYYKFVAKAELSKIPIFGAAVRATGFIFIDRNNRKAAFSGYETAAERIRAGASVVVHPEGTRGSSYALRPFKKGPFVLAVAAQAPIVPVLVYGTREVQGRESMRVKAGEVHLHFLEPIPTEGMTYSDRDRLSRITRDRLAAELERLYGIRSAEETSSAALEPSEATR